VAEQGIINRIRSDLDTWWNARPTPTPGQVDQERETRVSLGLMAQAADAPEPTPEQQIFLSQSEHGMRERLSVLLNIPHRSLAQEREKVAIDQWLGRNNPAPPPQTQVRGFLGPLAPAGMAIGMVRPWMIWTGAIAAVGMWGAYNDVRAGRLENERNEARATVESLQEEVMAANALAGHFRDQAAEADQLSQATAANIEAERARRLRAEREARRIRDAMDQARAGGNVDYGFGGVRDDQPTN
jgi:hypothetical protein